MTHLLRSCCTHLNATWHQSCPCPGTRSWRKGYDDQGWVVAQAPEYVIENIKQDKVKIITA